jgi:hypothetical protein
MAITPIGCLSKADVELAPAASFSDLIGHPLAALFYHRENWK